MLLIEICKIPVAVSLSVTTDTHHGIYGGEGKVVHYSGLSCSLGAEPADQTSSSRDSMPTRSLQGFSHGSARPLSDFSNTCEQFFGWCGLASRLRLLRRFLPVGLVNAGMRRDLRLDAVPVTKTS